jgi:hypothetical protein
VDGGEYGVIDAVDGDHRGAVYFEQAVAGRPDVDPALGGFGQRDAWPRHRPGDAGNGLVFVHLAGGQLDEVNVVLADIAQVRDVLFPDHVALLEGWPLVLAWHDFGHIMPQNHADRVFYSYFPDGHQFLPPKIIVVKGRLQKRPLTNSLVSIIKYLAGFVKTG